MGGVKLESRLARLEGRDTLAGAIELYLFDLDGDLVTGPQGERLTVAQAEHGQQDAALVIDLRGEP